MGTAGVYGLRKNGKDKLTYCNYDSYPDGLGGNIVEFSKVGIDKLNNIYDRIILVDKNSKPSKKQIEVCRKNQWVNLNVSNKSYDDWYCLLREMQGEPINYMKTDSELYMTDESKFIKQSIGCEYGYIINLDTNNLEFWIGHQKEPQEKNRYGTEEFYNYYPCKMVLELPLNNNYDINEMVNKMNEIAERSQIE